MLGDGDAPGHGDVDSMARTSSPPKMTLWGWGRRLAQGNWAPPPPASAPCHALLPPDSPTYMTPSLVFSAASVTPCLVFSTAPTTPSLAMEKPFLKTSMVVGSGSLTLPASCG